MQDAVSKLNRFVVEITMKAEFKEGCGLSKGAECRGVGINEDDITLHTFYPDPHSF